MRCFSNYSLNNGFTNSWNLGGAIDLVQTVRPRRKKQGPAAASRTASRTSIDPGGTGGSSDPWGARSCLGLPLRAHTIAHTLAPRHPTGGGFFERGWSRFMPAIVINYEPTAKQKIFHASKANEILYGGAAGGGKD